ncbi:MAG TPA: MOSC domain-containing protein [Gemmatimonadales bacterium]|jgi:MOSC domain-containing protein YiiM
MQVLSVQIGTPRTVGEPHSANPMTRAFTSAIWKEPVVGPAHVSRLGLEGDQVVNTRVHGGPDQAVLMYAAAHYPLWEAEWGRDGLAAGAFGENLTVIGLTEESVCIGDVLDIGQARLQVSQPRQPCATLARRHQVPDMIRLVQRNGRSGWYLRVLREGVLAAGDPMVLVGRPHPDWAVRRAARAYLARKEQPEEARALARCEALSVGWRRRLLMS